MFLVLLGHINLFLLSLTGSSLYYGRLQVQVTYVREKGVLYKKLQYKREI